MGYSPRCHKESETTVQLHFTSPTLVFLAFPGGSDGKESDCSAGDLGSIPGLGRSAVESLATHSTILAWRILKDRRAGWATVHVIAKSWTRLSD